MMNHRYDSVKVTRDQIPRECFDVLQYLINNISQLATVTMVTVKFVTIFTLVVAGSNLNLFIV